ncbi:hypothetical protein KSP40_PGU005110 [Platanthera guangdongensis]|uniref:Uncharacterized protein n=1 Tax=Platanthera guangdongensis TaxID=2320717 RepID=A0ABR2MGX6_9ASPA
MDYCSPVSSPENSTGYLEDAAAEWGQRCKRLRTSSSSSPSSSSNEVAGMTLVAEDIQELLQSRLLDLHARRSKLLVASKPSVASSPPSTIDPEQHDYLSPSQIMVNSNLARFWPTIPPLCTTRNVAHLPGQVTLPRPRSPSVFSTSPRFCNGRSSMKPTDQDYEVLDVKEFHSWTYVVSMGHQYRHDSFDELDSDSSYIALLLGRYQLHCRSSFPFAIVLRSNFYLLPFSRSDRGFRVHGQLLHETSLSASIIQYNERDNTAGVVSNQHFLSATVHQQLSISNSPTKQSLNARKPNPSPRSPYTLFFFPTSPRFISGDPVLRSLTPKNRSGPSSPSGRSPLPTPLFLLSSPSDIRRKLELPRSGTSSPSGRSSIFSFISVSISLQSFLHNVHSACGFIRSL